LKQAAGKFTLRLDLSAEDFLKFTFPSHSSTLSKPFVEVHYQNCSQFGFCQEYMGTEECRCNSGYFGNGIECGSFPTSYPSLFLLFNSPMIAELDPCQNLSAELLCQNRGICSPQTSELFECDCFPFFNGSLCDIEGFFSISSPMTKP